jgi:hypothetical protein
MSFLLTNSGASSIVEKIILSFDIFYSSNIVDDLTLTGHCDAWKGFLKDTRTFLTRNQLKYLFNVYKFTGDGWILLFLPSVGAERFFEFLTRLSSHFENRFHAVIFPLLQSPPKIAGIRFGADSGKLIKFQFVGKMDEYVGRAINVACRLQDAMKDEDTQPAYKGLLSKHLFHSFSGERGGYEFMEVSTRLRNIREGNDYRCIKVILPVGRQIR